jgi:hypothetical protein
LYCADAGKVGPAHSVKYEHKGYITKSMGPRLSNVFTAQVPDIPALVVVPGPVGTPLTTSVPAGPTANLDFIQINCGKRISAMTLLETNAKNRIALIQEPYTSINGCTLLHKRDFFCSSMTPPGTLPIAAWTSRRPRAAIYAPGRLDVLPVYRFMTRDIATVAVTWVSFGVYTWT